MVYEAMKRTMEKTMIMLQNRYVVDLFSKIRSKNIGTTEITSLCNRACQRLPKRRATTLRNTLVKWKIEMLPPIFKNLSTKILRHGEK